MFLLPFFGGGSTPNPDIYGRGILYGLNLGHTKGHIIRAFMEGLACNITKIIEYTERLTGIQVTQVRSLGGGSLSPVWCQIKADVLNRQVVTMKNTQDAACLGAAIVAGYGYGAFDSIADTALKFAKIDRVYDPNPRNPGGLRPAAKKYDLLIQRRRGIRRSWQNKINRKTPHRFFPALQVLPASPRGIFFGYRRPLAPPAGRHLFFDGFFNKNVKNS